MPASDSFAEAAVRSSRPSTHAWLGALIGLVALVALIYGKTARFDFVTYDDPGYVFESEPVLEGLSLDGFRWALGSYHMGNWHPLTTLSHMLDVELFGLNAGSHHLVSVGLHALNSVLLLLLVQRLTGRFGLAVFCAAFFAAHPLRVESVAWISERKDVLSGTFFLATLHAYLTWTRRPSVGRYALTALALTLGLMAKSMLVTTPFVLLLLDAWPLERWHPGERLRRVVEKLPLFALAAGTAAATLWSQSAAGAIRYTGEVSLAARLENAPIAVLHYIEKTFLPTGLAVFTPHPGLLPGESSHLVSALGATALLVVISLVLLMLARRAALPAPLIGWAWFLGMLVPVIGIVQVGEQAWADRYVYLPLIGLTFSVLWGADALVRSARRWAIPLRVSGVAAVIACTALAHFQSSTWRDSRTLYTHALDVTKDNFRIHGNMASLLASAGNVARAEFHVRAALRLRPDDRTSLICLGNVQFMARRPADALVTFDRTLALYPGDASVHANRGVALGALGRLVEAEAAFQRALKLRPHYPEAEANLARARAQRAGR